MIVHGQDFFFIYFTHTLHLYQISYRRQVKLCSDIETIRGIVFSSTHE